MVSEHIVTANQVTFEHFPSQQVLLLKQIAASLERIEGLLGHMQPTVVNISNPAPEHVVDAARKAHSFATGVLREHYRPDA